MDPAGSDLAGFTWILAAFKLILAVVAGILAACEWILAVSMALARAWQPLREAEPCSCVQLFICKSGGRTCRGTPAHPEQQG